MKDGLRVGSLKHTDHEYETDVEGKDSQRHKAAGAEPAVLVAGRQKRGAPGQEILLRTLSRPAHARQPLSPFS